MKSFLQLKNADEFDALLAFLEETVEAAHEGTLDGETKEEQDEHAEDLSIALRFLKRLEPEHMLLGKPPRAGEPYPWDAYHEAIEDDEDDDDDAADEDDEPAEDAGDEDDAPRSDEDEPELEPLEPEDAKVSFLRRLPDTGNGL